MSTPSEPESSGIFDHQGPKRWGPDVWGPDHWELYVIYNDALLPILAELRAIHALLGAAPPMQSASHIVIRIQTKGEQVPINVDTTDGKATADFEDDHNDVVAAPAGLDAFVWSSDNTAVLTVANDATDPLSADITPVGVGSANISLAAPTAGGSPVLNAAGTAIAAPAPVNVTVEAGPASQLVLSVTG